MEELIELLPVDSVPFADNLWVYQVFSVIFISLVLAYVGKIVLDRLEKKAHSTNNVWDDALVTAARKPLWVLIWSMGLLWAAQITAVQMDDGLASVLDKGQSVLLIILLAWFLLRLSGEVEVRIVDRRYRKKPVDLTTANAIGKLLRISVIITAGLVVLQNMGYSVSGVLAFGGVGGIAVGFAARDLLANFFGGLMVFLDRPFAVGDWVRSPEKDIEGTVEHIGWRLTRIRTFDQRPIYVPNAVFANIVIQNPSRMHHRRIFEHIGIRYDDIQQMEPIVKAVRTMIDEHEDIAQDQTKMIYFDRCAPSSVDFFIYAFTKTKVWSEFHRVKEDVLLKVLKIVDDHDAQVAFPTSTLHVPQGLRLRGDESGGEESDAPEGQRA
ncbi:mechanosensitive ion channel family protein [Halopseudomonas salegens]|uniref:MscS family membrane protein n=1 Tax=Halopseudomonas salegens TaxID=1434072 RepID=A0A1H2EX29_9GAMM|nr:mechanosensitive ion channel family protein [Halopseudomonas salegens]SDT99609.1 MscS family membrane protein [Halopseudomonas salegens]